MRSTSRSTRQRFIHRSFLDYMGFAHETESIPLTEYFPFRVASPSNSRIPFNSFSTKVAVTYTPSSFKIPWTNSFHRIELRMVVDVRPNLRQQPVKILLVFHPLSWIVAKAAATRPSSSPSSLQSR
jgi:hypothetical protein